MRRDAHACGGVRTPGVTARERREELDMPGLGGRGWGHSRPSCPLLTEGEVSRLRAQRGQGPLAGQQPLMPLGDHRAAVFLEPWLDVADAHCRVH